MADRAESFRFGPCLHFIPLRQLMRNIDLGASCCFLQLLQLLIYLFSFFYCFNSTWQRSPSVDWRPIGFESVNLSIRFLEKRISWNDPISGQFYTKSEMFQSNFKKNRTEVKSIKLKIIGLEKVNDSNCNYRGGQNRVRASEPSSAHFGLPRRIQDVPLPRLDPSENQILGQKRRDPAKGRSHH